MSIIGGEGKEGGDYIAPLNYVHELNIPVRCLK